MGVRIISIFLCSLIVIGGAAFRYSYVGAVTGTPSVSVTIGGGDVAGGGSGGGGGHVTFSGTASPSAIVSVTRNGALSATLVAHADGTFYASLTGVPNGIQSFGVFAQDIQGVTSDTINLTIAVFPNSTITISNLFVPPTVMISFFAGPNVPVRIHGYSAPGAEVSLFFQPDIGVEQITADGTGSWEYKLDPRGLTKREYEVRAKAVLQHGQQSEFTSWHTFDIFGEVPERVPEELSTDCSRGDLDGDGVVDMTDLSILLFWWERSNDCTDQNDDGIIDMVDASILFYWWTEKF
jgi:hypothetical protein